MPTVRFAPFSSDKKSKKALSTFPEADIEPPVVLSNNINIPAATVTHPNLYKTRSKRASKFMGNNNRSNIKKPNVKSSAKGTNNQNSDTDEAAYIAEAIDAPTPSAKSLQVTPHYHPKEQTKHSGHPTFFSYAPQFFLGHLL
jgi:hypothetical protein